MFKIEQLHVLAGRNATLATTVEKRYVACPRVGSSRAVPGASGMCM